MEYNAQSRKQKRPLGTAILLAMTTMAVVIGLFAGVLIGGRTLSVSPKTAEAPTAAATAEPAATEAANTVSVSPAVSNESDGFAFAGQYSRAQVVELAAPSVVGIDGVFEQQVTYWGRAQTYEQSGSGSGVILTSDGYIATCAHVVDGAKKLTVTLHDDTSYEATVVGADTRNDIAIIKIDAEGLVPATLGDSDMLTVGEDVIAIGNPLGELRGTATSGIVSAVKRTITVENVEMQLVQTDAAISPGNSGGGLFNASGKLIGIVNAKVSDTSAEGLGFAIPVNSVIGEINDILNYGYVTGRAYLGVSTQDVTLGGYNYGFFGFGGGTNCVQITEVQKDSAAEKAGLKAGDLILSVDGKTVSSNDDLAEIIAAHNAGDTAVFTVRTDGEQRDVTVTFGEYAPDKP